MATVVNFIDTTLQSAPTRTVNLPSANVFTTPSAPLFHIAADGTATPASITFTPTLTDIDGPISFACAGGTLTSITANSAALTAANMPGTSATVIASVTVNGQTYSGPCTINKVQDGAAGAAGSPGSPGTPGSPGANGTRTAVARLYQWAMSAPAKPVGASTYTWATPSNSGYTASDGWSLSVPANPGTPNLTLYIASVGISDSTTAATFAVSYASSVVEAWSQNGAAGAAGTPGASGAPGVQSDAAVVYQWAATIPAGPVGSPTWTWSGRSFGAAPSGWSLTPGTSPSAGMTLWAAKVSITDTATATTTTFNWTGASITAIGYAGSNGSNGTNGTNGSNGQQGASYVTAYCASSTGSATSAPATTSGKTSLPAANSGGITGTWQSTVPTLTAGQYLYQVDGIYDPTTGNVTWSIPYWSSLKVGSLSAITANMGALTAGQIDLGSAANSWHVDPNGNMWAGATLMANAPFSVSSAGVLTAKSGTFSGALQAATGTFSGTLSAAGGTFSGTLQGALVKASNLVVGSTGSALNSDPNFVDLAGSWASSGAYFQGNGAGGSAPAPTYFGANGGANAITMSNEHMPIDSAKTYVLAGSVYADSGSNRQCVFLVDFYDGSGAHIASAGWGDATYSGYANFFTPTAGDWHTYASGTFGANSGSSRTIPTSAKTCRIGASINTGSGNSATMMGVTALRLIEQIDSTLIQPGVVQTKHLAISTGGDISSGQTAYGVGNGFWLNGAGSGYGARLSIGNSATGQQLLVDPTNGVLTFNGGTVSGSTINGAKLDTFSASLSGSAGGSYPNGSAGYGTLTANPSGGRAPYTYQWSLSIVNKTGSAGNMVINSSTGQSASFTGSGTNATLDYAVTCIVTDANNRAVTLGTEIVANHGTPP